MARLPAAQQAPRVPRSRRDDRFQAGRPAPPKRAVGGWVVSVQDDTVTVKVSEEKLHGVIPLGVMPPVGAIVEVESRGDLLVIPTWFEGPAPTASTLDIPATVVGSGIYTTNVGGSTCISSNDGGTTYLRQQVGPVTSGSTGYSDQINFPATPVPGTLLTTSLVTVTKGVGGEGNTIPTFPTFRVTDGASSYIYFPVFTSGAGYTETVLSLGVPPGGAGEGDPDDQWITQAQVEAGTVQYNPGYALLNCTVSSGAVASVDTYWTYVALRVTYA